MKRFPVCSYETHLGVESVAVKVPSLKQLHRFALVLCPCVAVSQRSIQGKHSDGECHEEDRDSAADLWMTFEAEG